MMSGRYGYQQRTSNSSRDASLSAYQPVRSNEGMWDESPLSVTQKNTADDDWDDWDGSLAPKTVNASGNCNSFGNFGAFENRHLETLQSSSSQCRDRYGQQNQFPCNGYYTTPGGIKISSHQIGLVIGKGGSTIKELEASSGAKIFVKRNDVDANGMVLVSIEGDDDTVSNAERMITELIDNESRSNASRQDEFESRQTSKHLSDGEDFNYSTRFTIPSNMSSAVIGKGGQKIREIQSKTQTKIHVGDNRFGAAGTTVEIGIHGSEHGRQEAKLLIEDVVRSESEARHGPSSEMSNFGSHQQATVMRVPTSALGSILGKGGRIIKDMQEKTQTKIRIGDDRNGDTVDVTITGIEDGRVVVKSLIEAAVKSAAEMCSSSNFEASAGNGFRASNQYGSGGGDFGHHESAGRSQSIQNSERFGFGDGYNDRQQRSGFGNFDRCDNGASFGRSTFGSTAPQCGFGGRSEVINWDEVKELSKKHEEEKWRGYPPIKKNFYIEDAGVANTDPEEVAAVRAENNNIMVSCDEDNEVHIPNPVRTFEEGFLHYPEILSELKRAGFTKPSPIQMQGWPVALQGLDLIGIAQTGTGKTLAFLLPAFIHIEGQPVPRDQRGGPNVLVLSPTRELALQIEHEVKKYKYRDISCVCVYGGGSRREQINIVTKGVEIVVATPGRLNDLISNNIIDVKSVTYLVLDEADRMLDLGFEPEIRKILIDIRPDRQTIMTSATWPTGVRRLATSYMKNPIRVFVGSLDLTAVHSVRQRVEILQEDEKRDRLADFLTHEMEGEDKAIVFVGRKCTVDSISSDFALSDIRCQSIHGGREQCDREQALDDLKEGVVRILIATDVASRGLDIKDVTHIINFDFPHNMEEYVHRIGRTGRAGRSGESLTFMTRSDWRHAAELIKIMEEANQEVPREVHDMAQRYSAMRERRRNEDSGRFGGGRGGDFDDFSGFADGGGRRGGRRERGRALRVAYM